MPQDTGPTPRVSPRQPAALEPYGVGTHWNEAKYYGLARQAGVQWLRVDVNWYHVQPKNEQEWTWEAIDAGLNEARAQNLKVLLVVGYTNAWASSDPTAAKDNKYAPLAACDAAWGNYIDQVVTRYKDRVAAWEIWNEPDHGGFLKIGPGCWSVVNFPHESPVMQKRLEYKHLLDLALQKMKPLGVKVTTSGFARGGSNFDPDFVQWLGTQDGWFGQFDIVNYHSYGWPKLDRLVSTSEEFGKVAKEVGQEPPLWITEHGITASKVPDELTKSYLIKSYAVALSQSRVQKLFWFRLAPGGEHMTLLDGAGKPTAAFGAFAVLTKNWAAPVSVTPWNSQDKQVRGAIATLQSGKKVAILWSEPEAGAEPAVHLNQLPVNAKSICDQDGVDVPVGQNPLISRAPLFVTVEE